MLEESIQVMRMLFSQQRTTFAGAHYQFNDAPFSPKPVQAKTFMYTHPKAWHRLMEKLAWSVGAYLRAHPKVRYLFGAVSISAGPRSAGTPTANITPWQK